MYGITLDRSASRSQYRQLVDQLRARVTNGDLPGGTRLASTRRLAAELGIARGVVVDAIEQLRMEGYLTSKRGSGTFVRYDLVFDETRDPPVRQEARPHEARAAAPPPPPPDDPLSFVPGLPDADLFPRHAWLRCYRDAVTQAERSDLGYAPAAGRRDLREALARYLFDAKGIRAEPERIVVTAGSAQAFAMLAAVAAPASVAIEDPHAPFVPAAFTGAGCAVRLVPADDEGIVVDALVGAEAPAPALIYATPAHQFPLGGTLPADRRVQLLHYARDVDAILVEDDYDGEFRYGHHPVTSMQTMAPERVVHVGSFSKVLSPALRLGYMVVPPILLARLERLRDRWEFVSGALSQRAMALFLERGHFERHMRRARRIYQRRNEVLREAVAATLGDRVALSGASTGLHAVVRPAVDGVSASDLGRALLERGYAVDTIGDYRVAHDVAEDGVIVAYGHRDEEALRQLVAAIAEALDVERARTRSVGA